MEMLIGFTSLAGIAALISLIINVLKVFGVVKDGTAQMWSAGLNLAAMAILFALKIFVPDADITAVDQKISLLVPVLTTVLGYIVQLLSSKLTYFAVKGLPIVGRSNSEV